MPKKKTAPAASAPSELPARGWRVVLRRALAATAHNNLSVIAAGIAFYEAWAFFPALVALVISGAMVFGEPSVDRFLSWVRIDLPESFNVVVIGQLKAIAGQSRGISTLTLVGAALLSVWSAMRGVRGLVQALNVVYAEDESRPFWRRQLLAFCLSAFGGVLLLIAIGLIVSVPPFPAHDGEQSPLSIIAPSRWPILIVLLMVFLSVTYRYAPCRRAARWRWVTWGASTSAVIIVVGSFLFAYYAAHWAHYNPLLGSLGAVTIFLFWSYLNVLAILLGAEINSELERKLR